MTKHSERATYLTKLVLQNAKSFKGRQELDLCGPSGGPARWTLILGDNGVGKTTLLQCIAATAPLQNARDPKVSSSSKGGKLTFFLEAAGVLDNQAVKLLSRNDKSDFEIRSTYAKETFLDERLPTKPNSFEVGIAFSHSKDKFREITAEEKLDELPLVLTYGAGRKLGKANLDDEEATPPLGALFSDEREMVDAEELILRFDYAAMKHPTDIAELQRATFLGMLASVLPDVGSASNFVVHGPSPIGRNLKSGVYVRVPYGDVPLSQLSFGYQTMVAWLADLAWHLFRHYPNSAHPLGQPAIVLVDEIDLHLHPHWQREIQQHLISHFPAVQFIATAHSPLMAQAAFGLNLAVVLRDGDTARIENDPTVIAEWRIDQVVTSELFGLSPWSPEVAAKLDEQARLAQKRRRTKEENLRLAELELFAQSLPTGIPPALEKAMEIINRAAKAVGSHGE